MKQPLSTIMRQLKSENPSERTVALVLIGKMRVHSVIHEVVSLLELDHDEEVRAMAAWTLDLLGSPEVIPVLVSAMYDKSFGVRSNAGWALVHLAHRMMPSLVVPEVIEVLKDSKHYDARQMAYLILTRIGGKEASDAIKLYWH